MLGRLSGGLGIVTGGLQLAQGMETGNTGMAIDGGVSAVLAAGSFIPVRGTLLRGGRDRLGRHRACWPRNLGYGSASEMVADAAKKTRMPWPTVAKKPSMP